MRASPAWPRPRRWAAAITAPSCTAARIAAALGCDEALDDLLSRARAALTGRVDDTRLQMRCDETRRRGLEETSPREWDEYRYWRLQALRSPHTGAWGGV